MGKPLAHTLQLVGLRGLDNSPALCAPVRPVRLISPSSRKLLGRPSEDSAVRFTGPKHGPDDACILVGDRHRRAVEPAPLPKLIDPLVVGIRLAGRSSHNGTRTVHEQLHALSRLSPHLEPGCLCPDTPARDDLGEALDLGAALSDHFWKLELITRKFSAASVTPTHTRGPAQPVCRRSDKTSSRLPKITNTNSPSWEMLTK